MVEELNSEKNICTFYEQELKNTNKVINQFKKLKKVSCLINLSKTINDMIDKVLLVGDKFIPEINLRQPRFTYSACETFSEIKEQIQKIK